MTSALSLRAPSRRYLFAKRCLDIVGSLVGIVVLAPVFLVIAIAVLCSGRPVLFRQTRIGKDGRTFEMFKFRTLRRGSDPYAPKPSDNDPAITRVGRWLRRWGLDEVPQLVNILRGELTLVGPRPEMPFVVATYDDLERQRLQALPGLTGLWQISAPRDVPIHEHLEYDLFYLANQRFLLDMWIVVQTPLVLLFHRKITFDAAFVARWGRPRPKLEHSEPQVFLLDVSPERVAGEVGAE